MTKLRVRELGERFCDGAYNFMNVEPTIEAWNIFVTDVHHLEFEEGDIRRDAAITKSFLNGACSGGLCHFLTYSYDLASDDILASLRKIGATTAATELETLLNLLGEPLLSCTEEERWDQIERLWSNDCDRLDTLSEESDHELMSILEDHVRGNQAYYLSRKRGEHY